MIYLDYCANAPLRPIAIDAMQAEMKLYGNPSSTHQAGQSTRDRINSYRKQISTMVGGTSKEIIFTSGSTEAVSMVWNSLKSETLVMAGGHASMAQLPNTKQIPLEASGIINLAAFEQLCSRQDDTFLVAIEAIHGETGVLQPVREIARITKNYNGKLLCDATQAVGKLPVAFSDWNIDYGVFSAHKLGGPTGVGALWLKDHKNMLPLIFGGGQELGLRSGTENKIGLAGFAAISEEIIAEAQIGSAYQIKMSSFRDTLTKEIQENIASAKIMADVAGAKEICPIYNSNISADAQVIALDLKGICVSAGSACASGIKNKSSVWQHMGFNEKTANNIIRLSFGWQTTKEDIIGFLSAYATL